MAKSNNSIGPLAWLVLVALLIHVIEEVPAFPEWATEHFGTTSRLYFILAHIPLFTFAAWISYRASRNDAPKWSIWWVAAGVAGLGLNILFHVFATFAFGQYSPGTITALLIFLPLNLILLPRTYRVLGRKSFGTAVLMGIGVSVLFTLSLLLDVPI